MCGIYGIVSKKEKNLSNLLIKGLERLEYRGYDSVGISVLGEDDGFVVEKKEGVVKGLNPSLIKGRIGLGHTRWATHGTPNRRNAHPQMSCGGEISVVHNGIIENYKKLKKELVNEGHVFESETDTEVIPHLIEEFLKCGSSFESACIRAFNELTGSFAVVVSYVKSNAVIVGRRESPLTIGVGEESYFIASDVTAFLPLTKEVYYLDDYEMSVVRSDGVEFLDFRTGEKRSREPSHVSWGSDSAGKVLNNQKFEHFMLKELHEVPLRLKQQLNMDMKDLEEFAERIVESDEVVFTGAGTSYHACLTGEYLLKKLSGVDVRSVLSSEFDEDAPKLSKNSCVIAVSQSGETADTLQAINHAGNEFNSEILSIVNVMGSSIQRCSGKTLFTTAGPEVAVASQKAYCCQVMVLNLLALKIAEMKNVMSEERLMECYDFLNEVPEKCRRVLQNKAVVERVASEVHKCPSVFFLARGVNKPVAMEGSLKLKEVSYNHAESYPAGESKHGPIALIQEGFPVIFVAPRDETHSSIINNIMEMRARGALIISVINEDDEVVKELSDYVIKVPVGGKDSEILLGNVLFTLPLQLLAYYSSVNKGLNPDKPRNLAKCVTVK